MTENNNLQESDTTMDVHQKYTKAYVDILESYNAHYVNSSITKKTLKTKFFELINALMVCMIIVFIIAIVGTLFLIGFMVQKEYSSPLLLVNTMVPIISSLVTMSLAIIKLPKIIAKYLFDKNEDNSIGVIIKNIQEYEINIAKYEANKSKLNIDAANKVVTQQEDDNTFENLEETSNEENDNSIQTAM